MATSSKYRNFCMYLRGDDRHNKLTAMENKLDWYIGQDEVGNHGMQHIQLMFGYKNPRSLNAIKKLFGSADIEAVNDAERMMKYVTDESKRDPNGDIYVYGEVPSFNKKVNKEMIQEALLLGDFDQAMRFIEDKDPLYYISNQKKLAFYFGEKFDNSDVALYKATDFNIPLITLNNKVLVFIGETGLGKTQFALSHFKKPLHIRDKEDWRRYSSTIDGIILDDLDFPSWSPLTFLKLLDTENPITQNVKYGSVRIRANVPRIICCNHEDLLWPRNIHEETKNACLRRMQIHRFHSKLYTRPPLQEITNIATTSSTTDCFPTFDLADELNIENILSNNNFIF